MVMCGAGATRMGVSRMVSIGMYTKYIVKSIHFVKRPRHMILGLFQLTGDGTRVSYRGKSITMCGVKQADARLPSQHETGKTMNQSRHIPTSIGRLY